MINENIDEYIKQVRIKLNETDLEVLTKIIDILIFTKSNNGTIFTCGNGGSASTASHMANDFIKGTRVFNREGFKIFCLNDSTPILTCLANDFNYQDIFSIQIKTLAKKGDVLIVFSGSGNSPNIINAVNVANEMGIYTICFTGRDGGKINGICDISLIAPTNSMEQIEDMHMIYEHAMICAIREELKDAWGIEILKYPKEVKNIKTALFDFDGTVSLIREGWQDIMIQYFCEVLKGIDDKDDDKIIRKCVKDFVEVLTGKQTIFQCIRLNEEVVKRGGESIDPKIYKREYLRRLDSSIINRQEKLKNGSDKGEFIVKGFTELAKALKNKGVTLYLASGTDENDVLKEAELLGITEYFDGGIYGATDDMEICSKEIVIEKILNETQIKPEQLVSFGDGYVEIEIVKNIGGYSIGVASDEVRKKGINEWKRNRLIEAGASAIIPDFEDYNKIMEILF